MIKYIKRKIEKFRQTRTFKEYGYEIKVFEIDNIGRVNYAQWLHPFEKPKSITNSNVNFYKKIARKGGMVIDIGAHTGDTTVPMALAVGKEGIVLGLEPNRYVFKILKKNASLNTLHTNIIPLCFAATKEDGEFLFHYSDASFCNGGFLSEIENPSHSHHYTLKVTGKNLEKYLMETFSTQLEKLELIKIDAEGYDKEILNTIPNIIRLYKPKLMIECYKYLSQKERNELFDIIDGYGYKIYYLENFEETGTKISIDRSNMNDKKHFEILALPK